MMDGLVESAKSEMSYSFVTYELYNSVLLAYKYFMRACGV